MMYYMKNVHKKIFSANLNNIKNKNINNLLLYHHKLLRRVIMLVSMFYGGRDGNKVIRWRYFGEYLLIMSFNILG